MHYVNMLSDWLTLHPNYGLLISFIMAFAESMIFIGGIIPGSLAITAIGTLAGAGIIPVYPTLICAIVGAICGDFASFFTGRIFKEQLRNFYIFKKYPKTIQYGEYYFKKHGAKSVFFARFIGPIRAIVPAIAGMLGMKVHHFILANVASAFGWSVLFYFPGVLIGRGHEKIQKNLSQIGLSILIFIILPIVIVKLAYQFKYKIYPMLAPRLHRFWEGLLKRFEALLRITPSPSHFEYHGTCTEGLFFILFLGLTVYSFFHPIHFQAGEWLKFPFIYPFTEYFAKNTFNLWEMILLVATVSICYKNKPMIFIATAMALLPIFVLKPISYLFALSFCIQYLVLRLISHHRMHHFQFYYIFMMMFWSLATYLISIHQKIDMNLTLLYSLSIAQLAWLFLRVKPHEIKNAQLYLTLILLLPLVLSIFGFLFTFLF